MGKYHLLIPCLLLTFCNVTTSTNIECNFNMHSYSVITDIYRCESAIDPNIIDLEKAQITSTSGVHIAGKNNDDVIGFHAFEKTIQYFPRGFEKIFKNIKSIYIAFGQLKEVTQSDLIPLPNLVNLDLYGNAIEVVEPGLFDFNPHLELISFGGNKILHVDPNVFDNLAKLTRLWFHNVPCINEYSSTREATIIFINKLKNKCKDSELSKFEEKLKNLEKSSNSDNNLVAFENEIKNSKFSKNSFFKNKLESLKNSRSISTTTLNSTTSVSVSSIKPLTTSTTEIPMHKDTYINCCQLDQLSSIDIKIGNISEKFNDFASHQAGMNGSLTDIKSVIGQHESKLNDMENTLKSSQTSLTDSVKDVGTKIDELKSSQNQIQASVSFLNTTQNDIKNLINSCTVTCDNLKSDQNDIKLSQVDVKKGIIELKNELTDQKADNKVMFTNFTISQNKMQNSLDDLVKSQSVFQNDTIYEFKSALKSSKLSQNEVTGNLIDMRATISDIESSLNNVKSTQNEVKASINKMRITQNEIGNSLEKINKNENSEEKFLKIEGKLDSVEEKFESFEEKLEGIKQDLANSRHKMSMSLDEKIKGIEKRLMKRFEEILEEKLSKILEQKFKN